MPTNIIVRSDVQYLQTQRPWLSLYGTRVRPISPFGSFSSNPPIDPALIHQVLPDELLFEVFVRMTPYTLGRAGCVCRKWRYATRNPFLWQKACMNAWQLSGPNETMKMVQSCYGGSWRKMWISRPRLRLDGLFVSRNTYIRAGVAEWKVTNPVHLVCYYRYIRFYASGRFLYKVSPLKLKDVAKSLHGRGSKTDAVYSGQYTLNHDQVEAAILYPGLKPTVLRIRLRIRGTIIGAYNRLDLLSLVTSGMHEEFRDNEDNVLQVTGDWDDDESHNPDVPAVTHRRGLAPFVFVPFNEVETSDLNLPVDKMDYFVAG